MEIVGCIKSSLEYYCISSTDDYLEEEGSLNSDHSVKDNNVSTEEQQNYTKIGHDNNRVNKAKIHQGENSSMDEMLLDGNEYVNSI